MTAGIRIEKIWADEDMIEAGINASDGNSSFYNKVYIGHQQLEEIISRLDVFKHQVHGGLYDVQFGSFGAEIGGGAFHARLHFYKPGKLYITVKAQSEFKEFSKNEVASEAMLYMKTDPGLLDNFIIELKQLQAGVRDDVTLMAK